MARRTVSGNSVVSDGRAKRGARGFTLIELLVVLAIVALMLTIAAPRYLDHVDRARETSLRASLNTLREAIDKFEGDHGRLPSSLTELVEQRYLRAAPVDPITNRSDSWIAVSPAELPNARPDAPTTGLADVRSGAIELARDGSAFKDW